MKQEPFQLSNHPVNNTPLHPNEPVSVVDISTTSSDSSSSSGDDDIGKISCNASKRKKKKKKKRRMESAGVVLPLGFLDPLPSKATELEADMRGRKCCKQFWKSGDFEGLEGGQWDSSSGGMDHVRIHPRFLHSNATSHKWVLGAFAELLDNSLDEVRNGATYVKIDMIKCKKDDSRMLLVEDNGGGMNPDEMRQCMSLGFSLKSKLADTIGQYGNGFKTSTMRLGADVIVFSRCRKNGSPTQSIGLLSYTFLRSTGMEDIIVPMLDYERGPHEWHKMIRSSDSDWDKNVETIVQWSPFSSEADLLGQFEMIQKCGTRIIIYNLWEDDQGMLELDFDSDPHDIQIRGVNRDERNIQMAKQFPNSRHFLTYRHSLRIYASILYLRIPSGFQIILRGKDVEHHNIVDDMMMIQEIKYRPQAGADGVQKDSNTVAAVTMGFVKDAKSHIDVQGFNVYHKNRLIKPFWRLWNSAGSDGRGVIGVLEADFVEPAHDKQGFERTIVLSRLEGRLIQMQKTYWRSYCQKIGYAPRRNIKDTENDTSVDYFEESASRSRKKGISLPREKAVSGSDKFSPFRNHKVLYKSQTPSKKSGERQNSLELSSPPAEAISDDGQSQSTVPDSHEATSTKNNPSGKDGSHKVVQTKLSQSKVAEVSRNELSPLTCSSQALDQLKEENIELLQRVKKREEKLIDDVLRDIQSEKDLVKALEAQLAEKRGKIDDLNKDQECLINVFSEERARRDKEEEMMIQKLKDASSTIEELMDKVRLLEKQQG